MTTFFLLFFSSNNWCDNCLEENLWSDNSLDDCLDNSFLKNKLLYSCCEANFWSRAQLVKMHVTGDTWHLTCYTWEFINVTNTRTSILAKNFWLCAKLLDFYMETYFSCFFSNICLPYIYPFETQIMCFSAIYCANISKTEKLPADKKSVFRMSVTHHMWRMTLERGGGEASLTISLPYLFHFGSEGVLKII